MPPRVVSSKKRKAPDDDDTLTPTSLENSSAKSSKKSKKEQLAEARARAKQWAEAQAVQKKGAVKSPGDSNNWPVKSSANATPKKVVAVTATATHTTASSIGAVASASTIASPMGGSLSKLSLEQKRIEARARAKAWAAGQEVDKIVSKLSARKSIESKSPETKPPHARPQSERVSNTGDDDIDEEDDLMEDCIQEEAERAQKPPAQKYAPPPLPFGSPKRPKANKQATASKISDTAELLPPVVNTNKTFNTAPTQVLHDNTQSAAQDKLMMEQLVQEQVIANAMAFGSNPLTRTTAHPQNVVPFMQQQQGPPTPEENFPYAQSHYEEMHRRPYLMKFFFFLAILGAVVATGFSGAFQNVGELLPDMSFLTALTKGAGLSTKLPPCFRDKDIHPDEIVPSTPPFLCDKTLPRVQCPIPGRCRDGNLYFCLGRHMQVSDDGSGCVLNEAANTTIAKVEAILANWTTENFCSFDGVDFAQKSTNKAGVMFPLAKVSDEINVDTILLWKSNMFILEKADEDILIGLSDEYVDTKLTIPTMCWIGLVAADTLTTIFTSTFYAGVHTASTILVVAFAYPLVSLVCLTLLLGINWARRFQQARKKLATDVANVRQLAYQRMMSDCSEHVVLHLRDGIAMDMYPTSKSERSYIILKVWPRVVTDVRLDNRVLKTNRMVVGKPRDVWQWAAAPSKAAALETK